MLHLGFGIGPAIKRPKASHSFAIFEVLLVIVVTALDIIFRLTT